MPESMTDLSSLGTRDSFNRTLRHIVNVTALVDAVTKGASLADVLNNMLEQGSIERSQIPPIVSVILVNKLNLPFRSQNLEASVTDFQKLVERFQKWNGLSLTLIYHHPNVGVTAVNPANVGHWESVHELKKNELLIVYSRSKKDDRAVAEKGLNAFFELLEGKEPAEDPGFIIAEARPATPPPPKAHPTAAAAASGGRRNLTPKYSVQVTNELFHNGNVEAWKNVIESFQEKMEGCEVIVYHEGELIQDLNSLFKWGKVKHGGLIFFQVAGPQIKGVSRLQKYLHEAASPRFEAFLKHDVNKVLNLF